MKKFYIVFALLLTGLLSGYAETQPISIKTTRRGQNGSNSDILRSPMHLPIEVTFDDATGILRVSAPEDLEGSVYVYRVNGALEGYSETLNATFTLMTPGLHVISLQGENWIGEGKIIL